MYNPQVTVKCPNPDCDHFDKEKTVRLQHLGQEVYLPGECLVCGGCGWSMIKGKPS